MTLQIRSARWQRPPLLRTAIVSLAVTSAVTLVPSAAEAAATTLGAAAAQSGQYFGAAVAAFKLGDSQYTTILNREFSSITPENEMKWDATEPARNNFTFGSADRIVNHARGQNKQLRGHTLVWHQQLPSWVSGIRDANTLRGVMNSHINGLMGRYRGQIYAWDVVNEASADGGGGQLRSSVFRDVLGTGFLEEAFRTARAADPTASSGPATAQPTNNGQSTETRCARSTNASTLQAPAPRTAPRYNCRPATAVVRGPGQPERTAPWSTPSRASASTPTAPS